MSKGLIFTYVAAYGGALLALIAPFAGLLVYFSFAILQPESLWFWEFAGGPPGNFSRIVAIAVLAGWALYGFGDWKFGRGKWIVLALVGFAGWTVLSACFASDQVLAWDAVVARMKIVVPFIVGMTLIDSTAKLKQLAWVLMFSQAFVAYEMNLRYWRGLDMVNFTFGGMDNNCVSIAMVTGAGLAFFLAMSEDTWWRKWPLFAVAGMMAHVPMFCMSRGGMLGLILTGVAAYALIPKSSLLIPRQSKHAVPLVLALIIGLYLAGPMVRERFLTVFADSTQRDFSAESRVEMWADCWDVMIHHPLLGVGPSHWGVIAPDYGWPKGKEAHSLWFQTGAELGFPGLGFLVAFYALTVWRLGRLLWREEAADTWLPDAARMAIAAVVAFVVSASFVTLPGLELPYYIVLMGAGTLKLAGEEPAPAAAEDDLVEPACDGGQSPSYA